MHTVGPAIKEVPESAIAAQPPPQKPDKQLRSAQLNCNTEDMNGRTGTKQISASNIPVDSPPMSTSPMLNCQLNFGVMS